MNPTAPGPSVAALPPAPVAAAHTPIRPQAGFGCITPSANLVVERLTAAVLGDVPAVSAHYSRTLVRGSADPFPTSYDRDSMLAAAALLGDAALAGIVWNGSKGASIGFAHDRAMVAEITALTGRPADTSILAMERVLRRHGLTRVGVVSPYKTAYQQQLIATLRAEGFEVVAEAHAGVADNLAYMTVPADDIAAMAGTVAAARPQAILTLCTNFPAGYLVDELERALDLPIYDSVLTGIRAGLRLAGVAAGAAGRWGRLFREGHEA